jgi:hypothetical protein
MNQVPRVDNGAGRSGLTAAMTLAQTAKAVLNCHMRDLPNQNSPSLMFCHRRM